ncbi:MAG: hypothetical protein IJM90_02190 [Firmicutes bacterium]|nr:hypothetical protein [Bacillota bacterium]
MGHSVKLNWINNHHPANGITTSWGVSWPRGTMKTADHLRLSDGTDEVGMSSRVIARWPDGSIKWTGHSAVVDGRKNYLIEDAGGPAQSQTQNIKVSETPDGFVIFNGAIEVSIRKSGSRIIDRVTGNGRLVSTGAALELITEDHSGPSVTQIASDGVIESAVIEQCDHVRCVVKIEGRHPRTGKDSVSDFIIRLYIYKGIPAIEISYTMIYTGDPQTDFIKGLGLRTDIPMEGELYNRHIRLGGDTGFYVDGPVNLASRRNPPAYAKLQNDFIAGKYVHLDREADRQFFESIVDDLAVWGNFKLVQVASDSYTVYKRTKNERCSWLKAVHGKHSSGTAYAGGTNGGVGLSIRDFWQKYPSGIELLNVDKDTASLYAWFYSSDSPAMDLRHYDTETHMNSSYEGFDEFRATPYGIANTQKLELRFYDRTPEFETLLIQASEAKAKPRLVCPPEQMYASKVFGIWSLEDRSTPAKRKLEEYNDQCLELFVTQRDERDWYGFWDYGDIMRMYDINRHEWRFDIGGWAWNNSEITPNLWMWYAFIRSGREEFFNLAEAYTRHSSEVDIYHKGEYAPLGSRHNVSHWGCGCKEARISMAFYNKFYYYLTTDERTGDIMDEVKDVDYAALKLPPLRARDYVSDQPIFVRSGPDWAAFMSNWYVRWERYGDEFYRDKLLTGIKDISEMPYRLNSGPTMGYDPATGHLKYMGVGVDSYHMINFFGALEAWLEIAEDTGLDIWKEMYGEFGRYAVADADEKKKIYPGEDPSNRGFYYPASAATGVAALYYARRHNDTALMKKVWETIIRRDMSGGIRSLDCDPVIYSGPDVAHPFRDPTYESGDSGYPRFIMNTFFALELGRDCIPESDILAE